MSQRQREEHPTALRGRPGWYVTSTGLRRRKGRSEAILVLEREETAYTCGGCEQVYAKARPWRSQELQHLLRWEHVTILRIEKHRVACPTCGLTAERLP